MDDQTTSVVRTLVIVAVILTGPAIITQGAGVSRFVSGRTLVIIPTRLSAICSSDILDDVVVECRADSI